MALFQKKPQVSSSAPLYTIGANKTILVVGLGNNEKQYYGTRHNVGFSALDLFAQKNDFPTWLSKKDLKSEISLSNLGGARVILAKPTTLMNNSGEAASALQRFYRVYNQDTLVVYDELALPFGQLRARLGGQAAGHNGIKSLIKNIGADFARLRIGIANEHSPKSEASKFVLSKFSSQEAQSLPLILAEASAMITEFIFDNLPAETRSVL